MRWDKLKDLLVDAVKSISKAGADFALIASNTPHIVFEQVKALSPIPMLSIVEETCKVVGCLSLKKVGLFGTQITMQLDYYQKVFSMSSVSPF